MHSNISYIYDMLYPFIYRYNYLGNQPNVTYSRDIHSILMDVLTIIYLYIDIAMFTYSSIQYVHTIYNIFTQYINIMNQYMFVCYAIYCWFYFTNPRGILGNKITDVLQAVTIYHFNNPCTY